MAEIDQTERAYRAAVYEVDGIGPARMKVLLSAFGSAEKVWGTEEKKFREIGLSGAIVSEIRKKRATVEPKNHLAALAKLGIRVLVIEDEEYPELLKKIDDSPQVLFVRGHFDASDARAIAVVGTRKPTPYGREVTERLVEQLVALGFTIVSGLARGIDGIAHRTALASGGRTIGVLAGGVDRVYPPEHVGLAEDISKHGAVVSEFAPGKLPIPGNFPARNRVISGLALGVLVTEGAAKSGSKITATWAAEQGREGFAVPGPITSHLSQAPADLIKLGAKVVTDVSDILEELRVQVAPVRAGEVREVEIPLENLGADERKVWEALADGSLQADDLVRKVGMETSAVSAILTMLELRGLVKHLGGMVYCRK